MWRLLKPLARSIRRAPTDAEHRLWTSLRAPQLGARFRRQHAIGRFIVDFYCSELSLPHALDRIRAALRRDGSATQSPSPLAGRVGWGVARESTDATLNEAAARR